jgi:hypothetical protein
VTHAQIEPHSFQSNKASAAKLAETASATSGGASSSDEDPLRSQGLSINVRGPGGGAGRRGRTLERLERFPAVSLRLSEPRRLKESCLE